jgi:glutamate 5-kinase
MQLRSELNSPKRIVVKVGSNVITDANGQLDQQKLHSLCQDMAWCLKNGIQLILISSGAINAGRAKLTSEKNEEIDFLQAASSVGQPILMQTYSKLMEEHSIGTAQILMTHEDFKNRNRFLNARNTLLKLLANNILPILNENDAVSFNEITVGDNDHLAAMTSQMLNADLLLLLTSSDGLYTKDPVLADATPISKVAFGDQLQVDTSTKTIAGRGGMSSKLMAVEKVTPLGIDAIMAGKDFSSPLKRALTEQVGTYFFGNQKLHTYQRKAWLLSTAKPGCYIEVDKGAYQAILNNASLLPKGIIKAHGTFTRGDCVSLIFQGETFALGLVEYNSMETTKLAGQHSDQIKKLLGYDISKVLIHKDNLYIKRHQHD